MEDKKRDAFSTDECFLLEDLEEKREKDEGASFPTVGEIMGATSHLKIRHAYEFVKRRYSRFVDVGDFQSFHSRILKFRRKLKSLGKKSTRILAVESSWFFDMTDLTEEGRAFMEHLPVPPGSDGGDEEKLKKGTSLGKDETIALLKRHITTLKAANKLLRDEYKTRMRNVYEERLAEKGSNRNLQTKFQNRHENLTELQQRYQDAVAEASHSQKRLAKMDKKLRETEKKLAARSGLLNSESARFSRLRKEMLGEQSAKRVYRQKLNSLLVATREPTQDPNVIPEVVRKFLEEHLHLATFESHRDNGTSYSLTGEALERHLKSAYGLIFFWKNMSFGGCRMPSFKGKPSFEARKKKRSGEKSSDPKDSGTTTSAIKIEDNDCGDDFSDDAVRQENSQRVSIDEKHQRDVDRYLDSLLPEPQAEGAMNKQADAEFNDTDHPVNGGNVKVESSEDLTMFETRNRSHDDGDEKCDDIDGSDDTKKDLDDHFMEENYIGESKLEHSDSFRDDNENAAIFNDDDDDDAEVDSKGPAVDDTSVTSVTPSCTDMPSVEKSADQNVSSSGNVVTTSRSGRPIMKKFHDIASMMVQSDDDPLNDQTYGFGKKINAFAVHKRPPKRCRLCGRVMRTATSAVNHYNVIHSDVNDGKSCPLCLDDVKVKLLHHVQTRHFGSELYRCDKCPKVLHDFEKMRTHKASHGRPIFPCTICKIELSSVEDLRHHERTSEEHQRRVASKKTGDTPAQWPCDVCHISISGRNLKAAKLAIYRHKLKVHAKAPLPSFPCSLCSKSFTRPEKLSNHELTHSEERRFTCDFDNCGKKFKTRSNLHQHKIFHKEPRCVCDGCGDRFHLPHALRQHAPKCRGRGESPE